MIDVAFTVFGHPQGKGSKRVLPIRGKPRAGSQGVVLVDSNRNAAPWARLVSAAALEAIETRREATRRQQGAALSPLERGPVAVKFVFYFARPRGHYGLGRNINRVKPSAPTRHAVMPDVDKLVRCALDALVGVILKDDAQVSTLYAAKEYGEPERAEIRVKGLA